MSIALEQEYNFFISHLDELMKIHLNEFVVIKGNEIIGFFDSDENALRAGLSRFGSQTPFFIEQVRQEQVIHYFHGIK